MMQSEYLEQIRNKIFSDPRLEHYVDAAGTKQLKKYLAKNRLGKGFAVLSDYALYCKGRCYVSLRGQKAIRRTVEYRLDYPVIERINLVARKPFWCAALCLIFLILAPLLLVLDKLTGYGASTSLSPTLDAAVCLVLSLLFLMLYFTHKKQFMRVTFRGGSLAIASKDLPTQEERSLMRQLRAQLDRQGSGASAPPQQPRN